MGFWLRAQLAGDFVFEDNGEVIKGEPRVIIEPDYLQPFTGYEIHFGDILNGTGWCSVWLQFLSGRLVGHYILQY
ncbi:MAG: hypothetical protein A2V64_02725 [Bacteroidetes bacterium RBG_13_43_22]|nr:MAG: hypothetical protein A2V64_02725 [Bacteroidetes bacterium RBG_13_43_22]